VLGGALSPIDGVDPDDLKIASSIAACRTRTGRSPRSVLATNPTTTGEATPCTSPTRWRERAPQA